MPLEWALDSTGPDCGQKPLKAAAEIDVGRIDLSARMDSGETLGGTPTITPSSTLITVASVAVSTGALTIIGSTVSTAQALTFLVSGGVAGQEYTLTASSTTSTGQTLIARCDVEVV